MKNYYDVLAPLAWVAMCFFGMKKYCVRNGVLRQYVAEYVYIVISAVFGVAFGVALVVESGDGILQVCLENSPEDASKASVFAVAALLAVGYGLTCWWFSLMAGERQKRLLKQRYCRRRQEWQQSKKAPASPLPPVRLMPPAGGGKRCVAGSQ